jgi:hypothetical protein
MGVLRPSKWREKKRQGCASLFIYKKKPTNSKKNGIKGGGEERGGIRLQIFRFFRGWVWNEGKKKRQARVDCVCACVRAFDDVLGAFSMAEPATEITDHRLPATQVLRARSWEPNAATEEGSHVRLSESWNPGPESQMQQHDSNRRRELRLLIGLAWLLKLGFLNRYQYIKNLLKKRRRRY